MTGPDAPTEADSSRNGFLSYSSEWHAFAVGSASGLVGGLTLATPAETAGLAVMVAVVATALGLSVGKRISRKAAREVSKEPWYAVGSLVCLFYLTLILRYALGL